MNTVDIAHWRLQQHRLIAAPPGQPADVVGWLGAVQSQDYAAAKWALGLRLPDAHERAIEDALTAGALLRTHVMRPTWHFVTPADIRWMLALTSPRVHATNAYYYRKVGLDDALLARSSDILAEALRGGQHRTRDELKVHLQQAGVTMECPDPALRLILIMMHAELEGIVCSGARRGKQFTYALLDERVPSAPTRERDDALAELTRRYFTSHGPATIKDYSWWSGLSIADAQTGLHLANPHLHHEVIDDQTYWFADVRPLGQASSLIAHFLPNFDEYTVGYADRAAIVASKHAQQLASILTHTIIIDGMAVGTWKRVFKQGKALIASNLFATLTPAETHALTIAVEQYGAFHDMPAILTGP